jgi:hypothetical protein
MRVMKRKMYKPAFLLVLFMGLAGSWAYADEFTKEYHEEFDADKNTQLTLQNQYGNIEIQNWENPRIKIDVNIIVRHSNPEKAERMLDYLDVKFSSGGNSVTAETVIDERFSRFSSWKNENEFEINYTVQMPREVNVDLYNKYGHVYIDEIAGHAAIELKYGNLRANKLTRGNVKPLNTVNLAYASGSSINECGWLKTNIKYSELEIEKVKAFVGYTSYMKLGIEEASSVVIEGKYDKYRFGKLLNLVINTSYSGIEVDELGRKLEADTKYTNARIGYVPASFEDITINSKYGTYRIGLDERASYNLDGEAGYSKIYYHDTGKVSRIQENTSMKVYGTVGNQANPSAEVKINTRYGNVKLNE